MTFTERQLDMVMSWKNKGYQILKSKKEGQVKVFAVKDNRIVLLFVVSED